MPRIELNEPRNGGGLGWYISDGMRQYLHADLELRSITNHNEEWTGYFETAEIAERTRQAYYAQFDEATWLYDEIEEPELFVDKWWLDLKDDDILTCIKDDTYITEGVRVGETITIKYFSDNPDRDKNTYIYVNSPRGDGLYGTNISLGNYAKIKEINGMPFKLTSLDNAQRLFEEGGHKIHVIRSSGYLDKVDGLQPIGWSKPCSFYIEAKSNQEPKKNEKRLFMHGDFISALTIDTNNAVYWGNNLYYVEGVKNVFNSNEENPIMKDETGKITCRGNKLRLGRIVAQIKPELDSTEIESAVSKYKSKYEVDTSKVQTSNNVAKIYNMDECGGSCMAQKPSNWFDIYADAESSMVYIANGDRLEARALVHTVIGLKTGKEYTVMDRIFYDSEISKLTLKAWCIEQGFTRLSRLDETVRTAKPISDNYEAVPYIDNLIYAIRLASGGTYLSNDGENSFDELQETSGGSCNGDISSYSEDNVYCDDIDGYVPRDEAFYCETDERDYGSETDLCHISGYGYYREDDDTVAYDENNGEWDFTDNLKHCKSEDIWTSSEYYIYVSHGNNEGSYEEEDNVVMCEDIGDTTMIDEARHIEDKDEWWYYFEDNAHEHDDGLWYSYEEEEDNEEESGVA